jgi:hypothetical protein
MILCNGHNEGTILFFFGYRHGSGKNAGGTLNRPRMVNKVIEYHDIIAG